MLLIDAASGNLLAERTFHSDAGVANYPADEIVRALPLADGGFLLLGLDVGQYGQGVTLHRVDANLVPVWEKVLQNITGTNLAPTSDGGYLLTGTTTTNETATDVLLLKVDANGNPVFARGIGGPKDEGYSGGQGTQVPLASAVQTADGGYAFTASSFSYASDALAHPDFWTVKLDALGHVLNFSGRENSIDLSTFQAHDNTIASEVTATYDGSYPKNYVNDAAVGTFGVIPENLAANTGINQPTVMVQAAPTVSYNHVVFFSGEVYLSQGVYYLKFPSGNPFGYYGYLNDPAYIYHADLGYEYVFDANDDRHGVYLYDFKSNGFFYTSPSFPFPFLYDFKEHSTVYYYPSPNDPDHYNTDGFRFFYVFNTGQTISK